MPYQVKPASETCFVDRPIRPWTWAFPRRYLCHGTRDIRYRSDGRFSTFSINSISTPTHLLVRVTDCLRTQTCPARRHRLVLDRSFPASKAIRGGCSLEYDIRSSRNALEGMTIVHSFINC